MIDATYRDAPGRSDQNHKCLSVEPTTFPPEIPKVYLLKTSQHAFLDKLLEEDVFSNTF
jgi:hypothetical protein